MKIIRLIPLYLGLLLALTLGLQNCKKTEPDPVKPGTGTTTPGSGTTTPGSGTTTTAKTLPVLKTPTTATEITNNSVKLTGVITGNGGDPIKEHKFIVVDATTKENKQVSLGATSGPFPLTVIQTITGLKANTKYNAIFLATNSLGGSQFDTDFTTKSTELPSLDNVATANTSSDITFESAKLTGIISANGGEPITQYGHVWSDTKTDPKIEDSKTELGKTDGPFPFRYTSELKGLKPNTIYNVRAYATNANGTAYGPAGQVRTILNSTATVTMKAPFPGKTVSGGAITFTINDKYYMNSRRASGDESQFFMYDPATDKWVEKGDIPLSSGSYKGGAAGLSFSHNGKGYFGLSRGSTATKSLVEYDPATDKWKEVGTFSSNPFGSQSIQAQTYLNGKAYAYASVANGTDLFIELDLATKNITLKKAPPKTKNTGFSQLTAFNGNVYLCPETSDGDFLEYDVAKNTWMAKKNNESYARLATMGGKLYKFHEFSTISVYNPAEDTWKPVVSVPKTNDYGGAFIYTFERSNSLFTGLVGSGVSSNWFELKP